MDSGSLLVVVLAVATGFLVPLAEDALGAGEEEGQARKQLGRDDQGEEAQESDGYQAEAGTFGCAGSKSGRSRGGDENQSRESAFHDVLLSKAVVPCCCLSI